MKPRIREQFYALRSRISDEIEHAATLAIGGEEKHAQVVDAIVRWADDQLVWPPTPLGAVAEAVDGPAIRLIVSFLVEEIYQASKADRP